MTSTSVGLPTFARAREVHATLARAWSSALRSAGFKRASKSACAFARPRGDGRGFVTVGVQVSQWGESWSGNEFTLNAAGAAARPADYGLTVFRPLRWLSPADCAAGSEVERRIRERFPIPPPHHEIWSLANQAGNTGALIRRSLDDLRKVRDELWRPGLDVWLPYHGTRDVQEWGLFLEPRLQALLARAEAESPPRSDV